MGRVRGGLDRTARTPGSTVDGYRSLRPALRQARAAIRIAVLTLAAKFVMGLLTAAVTGWVLAINPAAGAASWRSMGVSDNVMTLVTIANEVDMATFAVSGLALLVAGVFVIRWQLVALRNLPALGAGSAGWSPLEAGVAWFVPVGNLFAPKQVFDHLWRSSEPGRPLDTAPGELDAVELPRILTAWWVLWVGATVLDGTVVYATVATGTVASMLTAQLTSAPVCAALVAAGIYLRQIISALTRRQEARQAELARLR